VNLFKLSEAKSKRSLVLVALIVLTAWAGLFINLKLNHENDLDQTLNSTLELQQNNWLAVQKLFKGSVELCFETFIKRPEILTLLQKAQDPAQAKQARIDLYRALYDHYKQRLKHTNNRFDMSIHTRDNQVFLRFSQPNIFGDDLTNTRRTIAIAKQTLKPVHSFDTGRILASYQHIMPVVYQGTFLGSIEYGRPFSYLASALNKFSPNAEFGIIYRQNLAENKRLKAFNSLYAPSRFSPDWLEEDPESLLNISPPVASDTFKKVALQAKADPSFQLKLRGGESFYKTYIVDDKYYALTLNSIPDIDNKKFAYLISVSPSLQIETLVEEYHDHILLMTIILLFGSFIFYKMMHSLRSNKTQSEYLKNIHDTMSEGLYVTDNNGCITMINLAAMKLLGYKEEDVIGQNAHNLFHNTIVKKNQPIEPCPLENVTKTNLPFKGELTFINEQGNTIWVMVSSEVLIIENKLLGAVTVFNDITNQKMKDDALRISATAFETQDGIMITDPNGIILRVNKSFTRITGFTEEEAVGQTPKILRSNRQPPQFYETLWTQLKQAHFWQGEIWNKRKDGVIFLEWLTITAVLDDQNAITNYVANFSDMTDRQQAQDEIEKLAFYDSLTDLPNRRLLKERLDQAVRYTKRSRQCGALFFIDLDNFKTLNDSKGHMVGDLLLQQVAERLKNAVREVDTIARLGGDEFVVLLENLGECKIDAVHQSEKMANTILKTFDDPFVLNGYSHHSSPSIGVEIVHPKNKGSDVILSHADLAMYQAKKQGRNTVRFFNPDMQINIEKMAELQSELRIAITNKELELYYQPQVDQFTHIIGAEALIRWKHPVKGFISPADFIPMAESSGLIIPIGDFVLLTACQTLVSWSKEEALKHINLSVNVSAKQFAEPNFVSKIIDLFTLTEANPNKLKLELTESLIISDVESTIQTMNELRDIGVRFSMDDFGTGYSSLSNIKRLPLAQLKIDQSFIRDLTEDPDDATIVKTIIAMSNTLNLEVVAEGVETIEQKEFLKQNNCLIYQGYLFSRPLPLNDFENLLSTTHEINDFSFE